MRCIPLISRSLTYSLCALLAAAATLYAVPAESVQFRINNSPRPLVYLSIGPRGSRIGEVSFRIRSRDLGNGTQLRGRPDMWIMAANRARRSNSRVAVLTVNSSIPLRNGTHTTPFTSISWTARFNDIPAGRFDGSNNQFLFSFPNSRIILDRHRFFYDNADILEAGTYTGRVTYTLTMP